MKMKTERTTEKRKAFKTANPEKFRGQLWERCQCGGEPVNMPSHLCTACIMDRADAPKLGGRDPVHSEEPQSFAQFRDMTG